jgi:outer membrane protein OmpA-like peptidoglycan-associated protein
MPSKNQIIAEAFQSIREFLNTHEAQLDTLKERNDNIEQAQTRLEILEQRLNDKQEQQKILLAKLEERLKNIEKIPVNKLLNHLNEFEQTLVYMNELEVKWNDTDTRIRDLAILLPEAIRKATQAIESANISYTSELISSLQKPVEDCVRQSISTDIKIFSDTLFPVMGPAIRKAIQESFKSLAHTINQTAEQSLSLQGIVWRLEARRKGVPFSEIVLQKTVVFQVEQVFLIHRETGLLIQHRHRKGLEIGDSSAVSAMLTAIQDFVRDSFSSKRTEELDSIEIGDYTVWLERGPYAVLACVIRGIAPIELRNLMRSSLEIIHAHYGTLLQQFQGDNKYLQSCKPFLEKTLQSESKQNTKSHSISPVLIGILSVIFFASLGWAYLSFQYDRILTNYIHTLQTSPGIVVISTKHQDGKLFIYGMRDPLAEEPLEIAKQFQLSEEDLDSFWTPYQDLTPQFIEKRLRQHLKPPSTVSMNIEGKVLYLSGHALPDWIAQAKSFLATGVIPGIEQIVLDDLMETDQFLLALAKRELMQFNNINLKVHERILQIIGTVDSKTFNKLKQKLLNLSTTDFAKLDTSGLINVEQEMHTIIQKIETTKLYFSKKSNELIPAQLRNIETLFKQIKKVLALSKLLHKSVRLKIIGNTDGIGTKFYNQKLAKQRAKTVLNWLHSRGIEINKLMIIQPKVIRFGEIKINPNDRNVTFQVKIEQD